MTNNTNGLRSQYPYNNGEPLSPRPLYDFPSPTSNYPSGAVASPGYYPFAYQNTPRFGGSAFIPPSDVFLDGRGGSVQEPSMDARRALSKRTSEALQSDPVAMHLLVETALGDSQHFQVLSIEEVEALKQEQKALNARLNSSRRKLESETKIRDAAQSLARLTAKQEKGHRRGLSSRGSAAAKDTLVRSEEQLKASGKKVEDLAREVLEIEPRMQAIDSQLLMHTAGILQLSHGHSKRGSRFSNGAQRPDSPASLYGPNTNLNGRPKNEDNFDDRSLYRSPDNLDNLMNALQNGSYQQTESLERQNQLQAVTATEKRLTELNERMRELIVQANPERNQQYSQPPQISADPSDVSGLDRQLDYLDQGLRDVGAEQINIRNNSKHSLNAVEGRLEGINNQLYSLISKSEDANAERFPAPPRIQGGGSQEQLNYVEDAFYHVEELLNWTNQQLQESLSKPPANNLDPQYEATIMGLWSIIKAGEDEARYIKRQRREMLASDPSNDEELSADEDYNENEEFSLGAFSAKVQLLYSQRSSLKEKSGILHRQIKQQRELNSRSDAQKEEEFGRLNDEAQRARNEKIAAERELERAVNQLRQFDEQESARNMGREAESRAIQEAQERCNTLEAQLREAQDKGRNDATSLAQSSARMNELTAALQAATWEKQAAEARHIEVTKTLTTKEQDFQDLEGEIIRLKSELTIAQAELDGAYGTRAERAAESAANPTIKKELDQLAEKNASLLLEIQGLQKAAEAASHSEVEARDSERNLKAELSGMTAEYEALTRDAIQTERDRETLETTIDNLRNNIEKLELQLTDEKVRWIGVTSPGQAQDTSVTLSAMRSEFKKMMRDKTAEGMKLLRAEQEERRKLEAMIRGLRKDANVPTTPQKSSLSKAWPAPA
ncbi:hypothetical protein P154DRAFT_489305 [Amniculicola lignicola CBS 123094]|uniref:Uncharacterized protein n=1 Tax=Amniculicola lignicola CBS 123094 TaxID=1392246 RepID=A0A6A5WS19_9PLEO|nr:hypothetical protein P154DRAFT_489305 [Amniculicola lignicola CBS 123094]